MYMQSSTFCSVSEINMATLAAQVWIEKNCIFLIFWTSAFSFSFSYFSFLVFFFLEGKEKCDFYAHKITKGCRAVCRLCWPAAAAASTFPFLSHSSLFPSPSPSCGCQLGISCRLLPLLVCIRCRCQRRLSVSAFRPAIDLAGFMHTL